MKHCKTSAMVVAGVLAFTFVSNTFGAAVVGVNLTNTITATMDGGTSKSGATWYERGVNGTFPTTGIPTGLITAQYDPFSTYLIQPGNALNALLLDSSTTTGELTFARPISVTGLSLAGASGNGRGTNAVTLRFSDGSSSTMQIIIGDWFNTTPEVAVANGRINIFSNAFANENSNNPRIVAANFPLAVADQSKFLTGIGLTWTGQNANTHTAIFGVSGDVTGIGHYTAIPLTPGSFNQDVIVGFTEVPEPGTMALMALGAVGLLIRSRRR